MELAPTPTVINESHMGTTGEVEDSSLDAMRDKHASGEGPLRKKKISALSNVMLRSPKRGIRCAGRNETTRLLWVNEFYVVHEGTRSKGKKYVYETLEFALGEHLAAGEAPNMTERQRRSIMCFSCRSSHINEKIRHSRSIGSPITSAIILIYNIILVALPFDDCCSTFIHVYHCFCVSVRPNSFIN